MPWPTTYPFFQVEKPAAVDQAALLRRLQRPQGSIDVVLDTDTYNEIDDQFALAYLIKNAQKLNLQAIYAAPFCNNKADSPAEGMRKSYTEIRHILTLMEREDLLERVHAGSEGYLPDEHTPVRSDAASHLAQLAMRYTPEKPLYVVAIAAITNVASALLLKPEIRDRIVLVWLGGHALHWHDNHEFNLFQDIAAARVVLGCGAAVVLVPCMGVVDAFATTAAELRENLQGKNKLCDYLCNYTISECSQGARARCWSKPIWDVTAVGWLLDARFMQDEIIPSPIPEYDHRWGQDRRRHVIRYVYHINRDALFTDLMDKLSAP